MPTDVEIALKAHSPEVLDTANPLMGLGDDDEDRHMPVQRLTDHMLEMMERMRRRKEKFSLKEFFDEEVKYQRSQLVEQQAAKGRRMNFGSAILTICNMSLFIFALWDFWDTETRTYTAPAWGNVLRLFSTLVILGQMVLLTTWHKLKLVQQETTWNLVPGTLAFRNNCGLWATEMCVLVLHYPPWFETFQDVITEKFSLIGFCRLYLLFRILRDTDPAFKRQDEYERTRECEDAGVLQYDYSFLFRSQLNRFPLISVLLSFGITLFSLSFSIWVLEREGNVEFTYLKEATWFTIVSMTTVGYGTARVYNTGAQIITNLSAVVGVLWWGVIIALVRWKLQLSARQHHSLIWSKQELVGDDLQNSAASLIQTYVRWYLKEKAACGLPKNEKWAVKHETDRKGFGSKPLYIETEEVKLRMESFHKRCRQAISLNIFKLRMALHKQKQLEAEGRGDPMTQVFSAIENLREETSERRETAELRLGQHIKLMRGRTKALTEHLRNVHFKRTNTYRAEINESYRNILAYTDHLAAANMSAMGGRARRNKRKEEN